MKTVIQRVTSANLKVDGKSVSETGRGLVVYLGVESGDELACGEYLAAKIAKMRIFEDENGKMNRSVVDEGGEILLVSQFTLLADCSHGNRPSFTAAESPDRANELYLAFRDMLIANGVKSVKLGVFGADMKIEQHNDGPVTIILER